MFLNNSFGSKIEVFFQSYSDSNSPPFKKGILQSKYLIVLDNFEVLLENGVKKDVKTLLEWLLIHSHRSKVLITTRRSFNLLRGRLSGNIAHIGLSGLQSNHSVWLMERLGMSVSGEDMARIYEKTGGHPFAIEFVTALLREEALETILGLPLSREDMLDLLKEVFQKLEPDELRVLKQISVLRRPVYMEALAFLAADKKECIKPLLKKTVLFYDKGTGLYAVHALVREYAYKQLENKEGAHVRAATYYEIVVEDTKDIWDVLEVWYHYFEAGDYEKAGEIVNGIEEHLFTWGYWQMMRELLEKTVETTEGPLQGISLLRLGLVCHNLGEYEKAFEHYEKSLKIFKEHDDKFNISAILHNIGIIHQDKGDYEKALKYYEESLKIQEELGEKSGIAYSLHQIGTIHHYKGDYEKALQYYEESLKIKEEIGNKSGIASSLHQIGMIHQDKGDYKKAIQYYEESLKIREEIGNKSGIADSLGQISRIYFSLKDYKKSLKLTLIATKIYEYLGSPNIKIAQADLDKINQELGDDTFYKLLSKISNEVEAELNRLGVL